MFGYGYASPMTDTRVTSIHLVKNGRTLCGIETCELKKNERWVERDGLETGLCSCDACDHAMEIRKLRLAGKPIPKAAPKKQR